MLIAEQRLLKAPGFSFSASSLALAASAVVLFFTALSINRVTQTPDVKIVKSEWSWMSQVSVGLAPGAAAYGPSIEDAPLVEATLAKALMVPIQKVPQHQKQKVARVLAHHAHRRLRPAPEIVSQVMRDTAPVKAPTQELLALRKLHEQLSGHFMLSMSLDVDAARELIARANQEPSVEIANALPVTTQKETLPLILTNHSAAPQIAPRQIAPRRIASAARSTSRARAVHKKTEDKIQIIQAKPLVAEPKTAAPVAVAEQKSIASPPEPIKLAVLKTNLAPEYSLDYSRVKTQVSKEILPTHLNVLDKEAQEALPPQAQLQAQATTDTATKPATSLQYSPPLQAPANVIHEVSSQQSQQPLVASTITKTLPAALPPPVKQVTTQSNPVPPPVVLAKADPQPRVPAVDYSVHRALISQSSLSSLAALAHPAPLVSPPTNPNRTTEAFDWVTPVNGSFVTQLTFEASDSGANWVRAEAPDHLQTLIRRNADPAEAIPLISNNAGRLLSTLAGTTLQAEAGIVFGKVASGWGVRLSGRSERPIFLNAQNQTISSQQVEGDRYFAFLNVEPGAHLLYLVNRSGIEEGAVGVSSLVGTATYLNLTQISHIKVGGKVFDGSEASVRPLQGAEVRVLGSVSTHSQTDSFGSFTIDHVLKVGNYSIYFETDAQNGFTHRYQVSSSNVSDVVLYRLNEKLIQGWVNQLEGSISPESGLIVAAAPNLVSASGKRAKLFPSVRSLSSNPTLRPEVYTLSGDGSLQVSTALDADNFRFISLQIPEGPAQVTLTEAKGGIAWSEMIMASPAVINMIGPF